MNPMIPKRWHSRLGIMALLGVALFCLLYASWPRIGHFARLHYQTWQAGLTRHTRQVGAVHWSYYEGGKGHPVVLLHGVASTKAVWLSVAAQLTPHYRVVIPDLPGWGQSTTSDGQGESLDVQAARVDVFLRDMGISDVTLVGHSMGGAIAGIHAAESPQHVRNLVLISTFGLQSRENDFAREVRAGRNPLLYSDTPGFDRAMAYAFATPMPVSTRVRRALVAANVGQAAAIRKTFDALGKPGQSLALHSRLGRLRLPVLALWCQEDRIIDVSALASLQAGLGARLHPMVLDGCSHMPMLERAEPVAKAISAFAGTDMRKPTTGGH